MSRLRDRYTLPLVVLLTTCLIASARAGDAAPKESWTGMYMNGKKIGYTNSITESSVYQGKPCMKITSRSVTKIELFGQSVSQNVDFTLFTDSGYNPIHQEFKMESNGSTLGFTADYLPERIRCVVQAGGGETVKEVPIPQGAKLVGDTSMVTQGKQVQVGSKNTFYFLSPLTVSLDKITTEVKGLDKVRLNGTAYDAYRILVTTSFGSSNTWETTDGEVLKGELPLGMAMFRETRETAINLKSSIPSFLVAGSASVPTANSNKITGDIALATAIMVDKPIQKPRTAKLLTVTLKGIDDESRIISDDRQNAKRDAFGGYSYTVKATRFDAAKSVTLPIAEKTVQPFLHRAAYLETDDPQIMERAQQLRGDETNAYKVATIIRQWVHSTMKPDFTIGVPRSCVSLYKDPKGVCRDYATLFAGVARAAGIPTRVVGGIIYDDQKNRFFYHAWVECWVGRWVALDPTLPTDFVDATHIKFAQGDVTEMYNVGNIVGRIKLKVVASE